MQSYINDIKDNISRFKSNKDALIRFLYQIKYDTNKYKDDINYKKGMEDISKLFDNTPLGELKAQMILMEQDKTFNEQRQQVIKEKQSEYQDYKDKEQNKLLKLRKSITDRKLRNEENKRIQEEKMKLAKINSEKERQKVMFELKNKYQEQKNLSDRRNKVIRYSLISVIPLILIFGGYKIHQNINNKSTVDAKRKVTDVYLSEYNIIPDKNGDMWYTIDKKLVEGRKKSTAELVKKALNLIVDKTDPHYGRNGWFQVQDWHPTQNSIQKHAKEITNKEFYNKQYNEWFEHYWNDINLDKFPIKVRRNYGDTGWEARYRELVKKYENN